MFEPVGGEMPGPGPVPASDPDGGVAGPPGAGVDAAGAAFTGAQDAALDRTGWDGPPGWLTAMDLAATDDPPVEPEPWADRDNGPWADLDSGPWADLDSGPWADPDSVPWPDQAPGPEGDLGPWPGGDARMGWPVFGEVPPSSRVAALLASVGVGELDEFDLVEAVAAWERIGAWAAAHQVRALAELVSRPMFAGLSSLRDGVDPVRAVALEVSARLRISLREADQRIDLALALTRDGTATLAALGEGRIDYWRAKTLTDGVAVLADRSTAARVEDELLEVAGQLSRAGLRAKVATAVAAADPAAAEQRHQRASQDRQVRCRPEPDGMGSTWSLMSAYDTATLDRVLDAAADGIRHANPNDPRTHAQRRADALAHLAHTAWQAGHLGVTAGDGSRCGGGCTCLASGSGSRSDGSHGSDGGTRGGRRRSGRACRCGCGGAGTIRLRPGRRPQIAVLVPYSTLIGIDEHPAELAGYGPLPASVARRIAADGTWRRLLTDPATGQLLDYGTTRYRPPQHLVDHVIMRDQTCCGIACTRPAAACDIDHTIGYPHGPTADWNLGPPCRPHHNGKTHALWELAQPERGRFQWRSPTGHHYDRPPTQIGPILHPPPASPQAEAKTEPPPAGDNARTADTDPDPPPF
jgi:Domain of unknown function (DUF222)